MGLVAVAWPNSEPESAAMVSLLQANEIPCFVHGAGLSSMLPGMQIAFYTAPIIMVSDSVAAEATELLSVFASPSPSPAAPVTAGFWAKVRMVFEALLFGRFVSQPTAQVSQEPKDGT